jgi:hypothetical protein
MGGDDRQMSAQIDLFSGAQFTEVELRRIAQTGVRNSENSLTPRELRKGRANRRPEIAANCTSEFPRGLFEGSDDDIADLELTYRQLTRSIAEKTAEQTACSAAQAPWLDLWGQACTTHAKLVGEEGFKLGGEQAAYRRAVVADLDRLRALLRPYFVEGGRIAAELRSLKSERQGVETEIKILKSKRRKRHA